MLPTTCNLYVHAINPICFDDEYVHETAFCRAPCVLEPHKPTHPYLFVCARVTQPSSLSHHHDIVTAGFLGVNRSMTTVAVGLTECTLVCGKFFLQLTGFRIREIVFDIFRTDRQNVDGMTVFCAFFLKIPRTNRARKMKAWRERSSTLIIANQVCVQ